MNSAGKSRPDVSASDDTIESDFAVAKCDVTAAAPHSGFAAGFVIDDFEILMRLGEGAFAQVYLARQISMQRLVALKVSAGSGGESQTLARLDHPGIVRVFDQRQLTDGSHLLYMQYLPGGTLNDVVRRIRRAAPEARSGKLLLEEVDRRLLGAAQQAPERSSIRHWLANADWPMVVAWIGVQLGRALHSAHGHGVYHRDVKPANVLLSPEGIPKLADFNVSFASSTPTNQGIDSMGGSVGYMSPEHLRAVSREFSPSNDLKRPGKKSAGGTNEACPSSFHDVKESADLYSTAVLLWELWQGHRPFPEDATAPTQKEWLARHLEFRSRRPEATTHLGGASERVLEHTLRQTLAFDPADRPRDGAELAARLRLALHPQAAGLFDPPEGGLVSRLGTASHWIVASTIMLAPNILAGIFNAVYNYFEIIVRHPEMEVAFWRLANTVNSIAFPLGGLLMVWSTWPVQKSIRATRQGYAITSLEIDNVFRLSHRAAWIGATLWLSAAVIYPTVLSLAFPTFPRVEAIHFFGSLLICGGVAAVYPFFGLTILSTLVYYPQLVRKTMLDERFDDRMRAIRRDCGWYLLAAAGIPLLGLSLLLSRESMARYVVGASVAATALGLLAAYASYQCVLKNWELMADVLSRKRASIVPGMTHEDT